MGGGEKGGGGERFLMNKIELLMKDPELPWLRKFQYCQLFVGVDVISFDIPFIIWYYTIRIYNIIWYYKIKIFFVFCKNFNLETENIKKKSALLMMTSSESKKKCWQYSINDANGN